MAKTPLPFSDAELQAEEWRVVSRNPHYEVSDLGRVRSIDRVMDYPRNGRIFPRPRKGILLRQKTDETGRKRVTLGNSRINKGPDQGVRVHTLVLEAFVGPRLADCEALHGDGNASNNRATNLRWGTHTENMHDARRHGTGPQGSRHWKAKLTEEDIPKIRKMIAEKRLSLEDIGAKFGVSVYAIRGIKSGANWNHVQ